MSFFELIFNNMAATKEKRIIDSYSKRYGQAAKLQEKQKQEAAVQQFKRMPNLLMSCYNSWLSLQYLRTQVRRNEEFTFGDQLADKVYDPEERMYKTERKILEEQGLQPTQYNIIRNIISRSIPGLWIQNKTLPVCVAQKEENQADSDVLTATFHAIHRKLELQKLNYSQLVQMLISGIIAVDTGFARRDEEADIFVDFIDLFSFFADNTMKDPRYKDCTLVGYFTDMNIDAVVGQFGMGIPEREEQIRSLYSGAYAERMISMTETFTDQRLEKDFFTTDTENWGQCRVIKAIRKESRKCIWVQDFMKGTYLPEWDVTVPQLMKRLADRIAEQTAMGVAPENMLLIDWDKPTTTTVWKYYYMTPSGDVLWEEYNTFWHKKPSIVFEFHEFFIGKIYPFAKDLIDTQKEVNRISAISTLLSKHAAKDVLFMPRQLMADKEGYGPEYIAKEVSKFGGFVPYNADQKFAGFKPEYMNTVAQAFSPMNMVNTYLNLSEKVSGVYGALQGATPAAGTPAQSYMQQQNNSATSLNGIFETANSFHNRMCKIIVQNMQQFYKGKRYIYDKSSGKQLLYDEERVKNIDVELSIVENTDTPAYRLMVNDTLMRLLELDRQNALDFRAVIEVGNWPFKDQLLDYMNKREQEVKEAQANGMPIPGAQLPTELQQGLQQYQFNPAALAALPQEVQQSIMQQMEQQSQLQAN